MKRMILAIFTLLVLNAGLWGQVPQAFKYQAIIRDETGVPIKNQQISLCISILQGGPSGLTVYKEFQNPLTNEFGLVTIEIGRGETNDNMEDIDWSEGNYFLRIEADMEGQGNYKLIGVFELLAVPYAMFALHGNEGPQGPPGEPGTSLWKDGEGKVTTMASVGVGIDPPTGKMTVAGEDTLLFEVKNKNGETVFAVFDEGVRIYLPEGMKGGRGGFAIGGRTPAGKGEPIDIFRVTPDSIRMYINDSGKGGRGGFAIGGRTPQNKGIGEEYFSIDPQKTKIIAKDPVAGFTLGNNPQSLSENFLRLSPENYFIGHLAGSSNKNGKYNSFIGYRSGFSNSDGSKNYFIGFHSGYNNTIGSSNIFMGDSAGFKNISGERNTFIGTMAGLNNTTGIENVFLGPYAGYSNKSGKCNILIGTYAGLLSTVANYNTFIGVGSGYHTTSSFNAFYGTNSGFAFTTGSSNAFLGCNAGYWFDGGTGNTFVGSDCGRGGPDNDPPDPPGNFNTFLGSFAGYNIESGSNNVLIGSRAGYSMRTGSGNVLIGYNAGSNETGNNKLYIHNTLADQDNSLIYGEFDNKIIKLNGKTTIRDVLQLVPRISPPDNPQEGEIYYNSTDKTLYLFNGINWIPINK